MQVLDLPDFFKQVSIWAIPALFAMALHEVAHGWVARCFGDTTAQQLGRLSLNPLRHIDPIGTLLIPGLLLAVGGVLIGWAKSVPVSISGLKHPRRAMICIALAGPAANLAMALGWFGILEVVARLHGYATLITWLELMCQAGMLVNVILAVFNMLPIPPLDGGRVMAGLLPQRWGSQFGRIEPIGLFVGLGFSALRWLDWLFDPALRILGRLIVSVGA